MTTTHIVLQGECLSSIAKKYGFVHWRTIYYHPENAEFRRKRPNPNLVYPGDCIFIPDKETKKTDRPTERRHIFELKGRKTLVRIRLEDGDRQPFTGKKFALAIGINKWEGATDGNGLIEQEVPADAEAGELTVWLNDSDASWGYTWELKIGHLDPPGEITGVQARLLNLGFYYGPVDGEWSQESQAALQAFQGKLGLEPTGAIDDATRKKLREFHDAD